MSSRGQKERLKLLQQGITPEEAKGFAFIRFVRRIKPKKGLADRTASKSGVETWKALPKSGKAEEGRNRRRWNAPRSWT